MDGYLVSLYQYIAKILQHYATSYFTEIFPLDQRPYVLMCSMCYVLKVGVLTTFDVGSFFHFLVLPGIT